MRVEPDFVDHPKLLKLQRRVGELAAVFVLRLWGHCQQSQRGGTWKNADAEYVEVVCKWVGDAGRLFEALKETNFVEQRANAVVIHDWDAMNSRAITNWTVGKTGGKPKANPRVSVGLTQPPPLGKPNAPPTVNPPPEHGLTTGLTPLSEGVSEGVSEGNARARVVTFEAALGFIRSNGDQGYTDDEVKLEWLYFDSRRGPNGEWLTERNQVISDWRSALTRGLMTARMRGGGKNGGEKPASVWELQQKIGALKTLADNHPANECSAAWTGEPTEKDREDLEEIRRKITVLERELADLK